MSAVVVDGMNVIGARPDGWWRDRDAAVRRLHAGLTILARTGDRFVLVLDGAPLADLPEADGPVAVRYARRAGPDAADDRILELVGAAPDPASAVVVTADRGLRERLAALGASTRGPRVLWDRLDALGS